MWGFAQGFLVPCKAHRTDSSGLSGAHAMAFRIQVLHGLSRWVFGFQIFLSSTDW